MMMMMVMEKVRQRPPVTATATATATTTKATNINTYIHNQECKSGDLKKKELKSQCKIPATNVQYSTLTK